MCMEDYSFNHLMIFLLNIVRSISDGDVMKVYFFSGITPPSSNYGTLRGLEHSLNPQLIKYAHETDFSIAQARREDRHQLFTCYPNLPVSQINQIFSMYKLHIIIQLAGLPPGD